MYNIPSDVSKGDAITATRENALLRSMRAMATDMSSYGAKITIRERGASGLGYTHPFKVSISTAQSVTGDNILSVSVNGGLWRGRGMGSARGYSAQTKQQACIQTPKTIADEEDLFIIPPCVAKTESVPEGVAVILFAPNATRGVLRTGAKQPWPYLVEYGASEKITDYATLWKQVRKFSACVIVGAWKIKVGSDESITISDGPGQLLTSDYTYENINHGQAVELFGISQIEGTANSFAVQPGLLLVRTHSVCVEQNVEAVARFISFYTGTQNVRQTSTTYCTELVCVKIHDASKIGLKEYFYFCGSEISATQTKSECYCIKTYVCSFTTEIVRYLVQSTEHFSLLHIFDTVEIVSKDNTLSGSSIATDKTITADSLPGIVYGYNYAGALKVGEVDTSGCAPCLSGSYFCIREIGNVKCLVKWSEIVFAEDSYPYKVFCRLCLDFDSYCSCYDCFSLSRRVQDGETGCVNMESEVSCASYETWIFPNGYACSVFDISGGKNEGGDTGSDSGGTGSDSGGTGSDSGGTGSDSGDTGSDSGDTGSDSGDTGSDSGDTGTCNCAWFALWQQEFVCDGFSSDESFAGRGGTFIQGVSGTEFAIACGEDEAGVLVMLEVGLGVSPTNADVQITNAPLVPVGLVNLCDGSAGGTGYEIDGEVPQQFGVDMRNGAWNKEYTEMTDIEIPEADESQSEEVESVCLNKECYCVSFAGGTLKSNSYFKPSFLVRKMLMAVYSIVRARETGTARVIKPLGIIWKEPQTGMRIVRSFTNGLVEVEPTLKLRIGQNPEEDTFCYDETYGGSFEEVEQTEIFSGDTLLTSQYYDCTNAELD